jgi:fructose-bisphosphate aldolase, class II
VATALQMISWGLEVNDYGNASSTRTGLHQGGGQGVTEELWADMVAYADERGWKKGNYKNLNLPFETRLLWRSPGRSASAWPNGSRSSSTGC